MSLFLRECIVCGQESVLQRCRLDDGSYICNKCYKKVKVCDGFTVDMLRSSSRAEIEKRIKEVEKDNKRNAKKYENFKTTLAIGKLIYFDDDNKYFVLPRPLYGVDEECHVFDYSDILDFEVVEDGASIAKGGLGKALVGGAVFGVAGAVAGGTSKKTMNTCSSMNFIITTKYTDKPVVYIKLVDHEIQKNGFTYKSAFKNCQKILAKFKQITDQIEEKNEKKNKVAFVTSSPADEIKKFKELLDAGIITENEFNKKKKQLLK